MTTPTFNISALTDDELQTFLATPTRPSDAPFDLLAHVLGEQKPTPSELYDAILLAREEQLQPMLADQVLERDGKKPCSRCFGQGRLAAYWYVDGGVCFRCGGSGIEPLA